MCSYRFNLYISLFYSWLSSLLPLWIFFFCHLHRKFVVIQAPHIWVNKSQLRYRNQYIHQHILNEVIGYWYIHNKGLWHWWFKNFYCYIQSLHIITQNLPGQQIEKHDHELPAKTTKKFVSRPPDHHLCIPACLDLLAACAEPSESRKISSKREKNEVRNRGLVLGLFTSLLCAGRPAANLQPCVISLRKQSAHNYPRGAAGRTIARCTHFPKQSWWMTYTRTNTRTHACKQPEDGWCLIINEVLMLPKRRDFTRVSFLSLWSYFFWSWSTCGVSTWVRKGLGKIKERGRGDRYCRRQKIYNTWWP